MEELSHDINSMDRGEVEDYGVTPTTEVVREKDKKTDRRITGGGVETPVIDDLPPAHVTSLRETIMEYVFGYDEHEATPLESKVSLM